MRLARLAFLFTILTGSQVFAQGLTWDSSGDGMLNGTYYFRQAAWIGSSSAGYALFGSITFSGTGTYTMNTPTYVQAGSGNEVETSITGTYSIGAGGFGFLSDPLGNSGAQIRGMVANGVFIGSDTEGGYNGLFIAAQIGSPTPTAATFSGAYSMAYTNFPSPLDGDFYDASFTINANGAGSAGTVAASGYYLNSSTVVTQNASAKYTASNGAVVMTFPTLSNNTSLLSGQEYLYFSPDGNFVFGGSPTQADMLVGVKNGGSSPILSSTLYYNAGVFTDASNDDLDTYYGSLSLNSGVEVLHSRFFSAGLGQSFDSITTQNAPTSGGSTYTDGFYNYTIGAGGNYRIGFGLASGPGIDVALAAPAFAGSGVYLNPTGVLNAGSYAPFTAGVSPGELLVLTGTNLAPNTTIGAADIDQTANFPTKLNGVQVLIDGIPAPLYYVSATQCAAIVPYAASDFTFATIQVNNNGILSHTVSEFLNPGTPGVFTIPADGVGFAAAEHGDGSLVTQRSPAQPGETIAVYLTGLGQIFPPIQDGTPGSQDITVNTIAASIDDATAGTSTTAAVLYSGLAPTLTGLYQMNLTIPTGLTVGDQFYLEVDILNSLGNPTAVSEEALIPIGSGGLNVPVVRPEIQNSQPYKANRHHITQPLKSHIVVKSVQP
jgi:uncharacterized protein (TIGR03437 family)